MSNYQPLLNVRGFDGEHYMIHIDSIVMVRAIFTSELHPHPKRLGYEITLNNNTVLMVNNLACTSLLSFSKASV